MNQADIFDAIVGSLLREPAVADDPDWEYLTTVATMGDGVTDVLAYSYADGPGKAVQLNDPPFDELKQLHAATAGPDGTRWRFGVFKIDRDRNKVNARFFGADDAEQFEITPDNFRDTIESLRPQPSDFADTPPTSTEDPA